MEGFSPRPKPESLPEQEPTVAEAMAELQALQAQVWATGAVDTELRQFADIMRALEEGDIKPKRAIERGRKILEGRQDYH